MHRRRTISKKRPDLTVLDRDAGTGGVITEVRRKETLLEMGALHNAIFNSANVSSIATDDKGVIQLRDVGTGYTLG